MNPDQVNCAQYPLESSAGHYESFFLRANHPALPQAFWFRYTTFVPNKNPENAIAELWGVWFDRTQNKHIAVKKEIPLKTATFDNHQFRVIIGDAQLSENQFSGSAQSNQNELSWNLAYRSTEPPLLVLPPKLYQTSIPKAKLLVGKPLANFWGEIIVNGQKITIENWVGSQNHNWGSQHTDYYAWGQVAGFDNFPDSFLEVATARLKFGPFWTPFLTILALKHRGQSFYLNTIPQAIKANAKFRYFDWQFQSQNNNFSVQGSIAAQKQDFVGLKYHNPPGGIKACLNTKIASCAITISYLDGSKNSITETLTTQSRCAFEILTNDLKGHQIPLEV